MPPAPHAPAEIDLADVVLRRWHPDHAEALAATVAANVDHLRPWMPWIEAEPLPLRARRELLERWQREWDVGGDRHWGIFVAGRAIGSIGLMGRIGPGGVDMGYWIDHRFTGRGIVTRCAGAVTSVAFANPHVERVEIHHDRANRASGGVPARLGYRLTGVEAVEVGAPGESGVRCVWEMRTERWSDPTRPGGSPEPRAGPMGPVPRRDSPADP